MELNEPHDLTVLRVPGELAQHLRRLAVSAELENPLVICEFGNGEECLFDIQKGLFLSKPNLSSVPSRETLKAFGRFIQNLREVGGAFGSHEHRPGASPDVELTEFAVVA